MDGQTITLPSGNVVRVLAGDVGVDNLGLEGLVAEQLLPALRAWLNGDQSLVAEISDENWVLIADVMDDVFIRYVIEPKVAPVPEDDDDRDEDTLYVDEVDFNDKGHIFGYVIGSNGGLGAASN